MGLHPWGMTPKQAKGLQVRLRKDLIAEWDNREVHTVAGIAAASHRQSAAAAVAIVRYPDLQPVEGVTAEAAVSFPLSHALRSFREGPVAIEAWFKLKQLPDLVLVDGHGIAHPRGFGFAAHMGLWFDLPTFGVSLERMTGVFVRPCTQCGGVSNLFDETDPRRVIGAVLRTKDGSKPVFVSTGHRIDLFHAIHFALQCSAGHRLPEPLRQAHRLLDAGRIPG